MPARIIDGKTIAQKLRAEIAAEVAALGFQPGLAVVLAGNNPASEVYVRNKEKAALAAGFHSRLIRLPETVSERDLLEVIATLNADSAVHGILVQLPLPAQVSERAVIETINPAKDVDGFHPVNIGRLVAGQDTLEPCTPQGCMRLVRAAMGDDLAGKHAVVVGRSNIVGKPMALMLLAAHCTVTICHSRSRDLPSLVRQGDIVVVAVGKPLFIQGNWIKPGAVVIDVGINRTEGGLAGDVDYAPAREVAGHITPVPGGVGPMTIACLLANTLTAARQIMPQ